MVSATPSGGSHRSTSIFMMFYIMFEVLGQIFSIEEGGAFNLTMVMRRLLCSWRTSELTTGRVSKTLDIRDYSTQRSLFVFGFISGGSAGEKQLGTDVPLRQSLLPSKHGEFSPIIAEKILSSASGVVRNRGRASRNLLPGIRSKLRIQVRHRERAHFRGRWHPLWRRYAEVADLNRIRLILADHFYGGENSFSALLEAKPAEG